MAPAAVSSKIVSGKPVITNSGLSVRVRHSEFISDVVGSVAYAVTGYTVQPGLQTSFPWLCNMAALYESYTVEKLQYSFCTAKSTATNGNVLMAIDYDVLDPAPPLRTQFMSYAGATRSAPWQDCSYIASVGDLNKVRTRYVRSGIVATADNRIQDVGTFYIATLGCADTSVLGELYCTYDIIFSTPQFDLAAYAAQGSNRSVATIAISGTQMLGTTPSLNLTGSGMAITYNTTTGGIQFANAGSYLLNFNVTHGGVSGTFVPAITTGSRVSAITIVNSATNTSIQWTVEVNNVTDIMTVSGLSYTSPTAATLRVASYPFGL